MTAGRQTAMPPSRRSGVAVALVKCCRHGRQRVKTTTAGLAGFQPATRACMLPAKPADKAAFSGRRALRARLRCHVVHRAQRPALLTTFRLPLTVGQPVHRRQAFASPASSPGRCSVAGAPYAPHAASGAAPAPCPLLSHLRAYGERHSAKQVQHHRRQSDLTKPQKPQAGSSILQCRLTR